MRSVVWEWANRPERRTAILNNFTKFVRPSARPGKSEACV